MPTSTTTAVCYYLEHWPRRRNEVLIVSLRPKSYPVELEMRLSPVGQEHPPAARELREGAISGGVILQGVPLRAAP